MLVCPSKGCKARIKRKARGKGRDITFNHILHKWSSCYFQILGWAVFMTTTKHLGREEMLPSGEDPTLPLDSESWGEKRAWGLGQPKAVRQTDRQTLRSGEVLLTSVSLSLLMTEQVSFPWSLTSQCP